MKKCNILIIVFSDGAFWLQRKDNTKQYRNGSRVAPVYIEAATAKSDALCRRYQKWR